MLADWYPSFFAGVCVLALIACFVIYQILFERRERDTYECSFCGATIDIDKETRAYRLPYKEFGPAVAALHNSNCVWNVQRL